MLRKLRTGRRTSDSGLLQLKQLWLWLLHRLQVGQVWLLLHRWVVDRLAGLLVLVD
jgi:hypothetical protein